MKRIIPADEKPYTPFFMEIENPTSKEIKECRSKGNIVSVSNGVAYVFDSPSAFSEFKKQSNEYKRFFNNLPI